MGTVSVRSFPRRCKSVLYFFWLLSVLACLMVVFSTSAFAQTSSASAASVQFTQQARIGFHAGDDWEPSITTDRYGHVYALYKHYDVAGGQTCAGCDLHLLVQRSSDEGRTWTTPRPIAPVEVKGGQYDPQIVVDPVDG
ncbi:MAG: glycoside hydrolase, partial [Chloroflexota bacterium]|nr:glycoside hydrolase [Chloroflexota bacterium]